MRSVRIVRLTWLFAAACADAAGSAASTDSSPAAGPAAAPIISPQAGAIAPQPSAAGISGTLAGQVQAGSNAAAITGGAPALVMSALASAAGSGAPPSMLATLSTTSPNSCPSPPIGATLLELDALNAVNNLRIAAGAACVSLDLTIGMAANAHCAYYAQNKGGGDPMCTNNPHYEVMGCAGYTGATPVERMQAAGFLSSGGGEVMAFLDDPLGAIQTWVDSVWHRIPILDPGTMILGYGAADGCDTIDFGPKRNDAASVVVYPYDKQTGVTLSFDGRNEGPTPPAPVSGWPSANPISLYAQGVMVAEHQLFIDGDPTPIEHVWLDPLSPALTDEQKRMLRNVVFMYGNAPFLPNTTYRVKMGGTYTGGTLAQEWTFTTGNAPVRRGR